MVRSFFFGCCFSQCVFRLASLSCANSCRPPQHGLPRLDKGRPMNKYNYSNREVDINTRAMGIRLRFCSLFRKKIKVKHRMHFPHCPKKNLALFANRVERRLEGGLVHVMGRRISTCGNTLAKHFLQISNGMLRQHQDTYHCEPGSRAAHPSEPVRQREGCYWTRLRCSFASSDVSPGGRHQNLVIMLLVFLTRHCQSKEIKICCVVLRRFFRSRHL